MAEPLGEMLLAARARWMIGGEAMACDHPLTREATAAEADLRLLAVAGQYQRFRQPPQPPALAPRPDLPTLALPLLPEALRPLARRLLQDKSDRTPLWLAGFVARRGYVLHPADWLPPPGADLPPVYRPLQLWQAGQAGTAAPVAEAWIELPKAERIAQFAALRATDPMAAQALLFEHFAQRPAEERMALVEALATGLAVDDVAFLQSLATERSEKVRKAAVHLLARLGQSQDDPLATEAAAMFELATEGLLRRRRVVRLVPKLKDGQLRRLVQTLPEITLQALARALDLDAADFVALWDQEKAPQEVVFALSAMVARTAGEAEVAAYWQKLQARPDLARPCLPQFVPRLGPGDRQSAILWLISQQGIGASPEVLVLIGPGVAPPVSAALVKYQRLLVDLVGLSRDPRPEQAGSARVEAQRLAHLLSHLGLLLTAEDAARVVQGMVQAGINPADPILDRLTFNAALKGS